MKKILFTIATAVLALSANAQTVTDAQTYFDDKAWGWASVSNESGNAYEMNGGMRAAQPKTIILTSNGTSSNGDEILNAIKNYDIIVLDGSKGEFIIDGKMQVSDMKNKTIVGRNNATLATKFFFVADDITFLKSKNLENLSSTDQYTGTLLDGTTLTCDKRAFFTKNAVMELMHNKTGKYTLPNRSGIFEFDKDCENIIVRNLKLQGPGAVDIDGCDLIYNAYATHLWIDHCTFIDSQDGALDTRGDYSTYTWNNFYYTSRSFSHAYTCGVGWVKDHSTTLHTTWGYNVWGAGCQRRLPQADDSYIHLVNNYHNCAGNSAGMTLNSYTKALVEGNYAASGVKNVMEGSGDKRYIYARNNSFSYSSTSTTVTMPYQYNRIDYKQVPAVLSAKHGAGATLDFFMPGESQTISEDNFGFYNGEAEMIIGGTQTVAMKNLLGAYYTLTSDNEDIVTIDAQGKVEAKAAGTATITATVTDDLYGTFSTSLTINVTAPNKYETVKKWDFKRSTATKNAMIADNNWTADGDSYIYAPVLSNESLTADGKVIPESEGLLITSIDKKVQWYSDRLRFNKENTTICIPASMVKANDKLIVNWKSANTSDQRGFKLTRCSEEQILTDGTLTTKEVVVQEEGDVVLTVTGGIYVYYIELQRQGSTGIKITESASINSKKQHLYSLDGRLLKRNVTIEQLSELPKGAYIFGGKKIVTGK